MSNRRTTIKTDTSKKRPRRHLLVIYGALILFGIVLLVLSSTSINSPRFTPTRNVNTEGAAEGQPRRLVTGEQAKPAETDSADRRTLVDDDGTTLWVSPTDGPPIDVAYLPPGVQLILAVRPEAIAEHPEGEKIFAALGATGAAAIESLERHMPSPRGVTKAVFGFVFRSSDGWNVTEVLHLSNETATEYLARQLNEAEKNSHAGKDYWLLGDRAYYVPNGRGDVLVSAPSDSIAEILDLEGESPPLRRDVERLLSYTDADRDATVIVTPNSLFSDGRSMFEGELSGLREPLFWLLGDELSAAALSLDWGDDFFVEVIATPTLETSPERAARILSDRVAEIPDKIEAYVSTLNPQPYGKMVISRLPGMVRKLSTYTRSGFDKDHAVLRAYLPVVAGHNLLMATELTLAEQPSQASPVMQSEDRTVAAENAPAMTIDEKLKQPTSLRFDRDTLEAALEQLSQDIGVTIEVRGPDLQADGITKNQSFGIDLNDRPADELLVEILRLANPDKTATGPNDAKQKLVFVIEKGAGEVGKIVVTTRAAAASRGDELPPVFRIENP